ncbi:MAG: hypothetical protein ACR2LI_05710 [Propionibacteriaceae bacterium]
MSVYARQSWRFARQLASDAFVVAWTVVWVVVGVAVHRAVAALAGPATQTAESVRRLQEALTAAADQAGQLPGLGEQLRRPFDAAAGSLGPLISAAAGQATDIEHLAVMIGVLTVVLPVSLLLVIWLPVRIRFVRASRSAQRFVDSSADLQLFALRALAGQPMHVLARISDDPVRAWRDGDPAVITALAEAELRRCGMTLPASARFPAADSSG